MEKFNQEFNTLNYVLKESEDILLFAHSRPDSDTAGSVLALFEYLKSLRKNIRIACFDPIPEYLEEIAPTKFEFPGRLNLSKFKLVIACDSVDRGFNKIIKNFSEDQVIALIDHHPDINSSGDINIIDPKYSSVCEIIFDFFNFNKIEITQKIATFLLMGILWDTGMFQHSNTTPKIMSAASFLIKKGARLPKIVDTLFANKKICTLKLWGRAFEKARINQKNGMIISVLTKKDIQECEAGNEDIAQVSNILNTVPGTKFSLIISEREDGMIKGSLRSEEYKKVDVSKIARYFGGGGHRLASGFEIKGKIVETEKGWEIT